MNEFKDAQERLQWQHWYNKAMKYKKEANLLFGLLAGTWLGIALALIVN